MIETFTAPECLPFSVALTIMVMLGFIEGIGTVIGLGVSDLLDSLLPNLEADVELDIDSPDLNASSGFEVGHLNEIGPFTRMLSWLRIGRVPILVLAVLFLLVFGIGGLTIQAVLYSTIGIRMPALLATIPALGIAIPSMNIVGGWAEKLIPRDETSAVSAASFVGKVAVISVGRGTVGSPAQARFRDAYGQAHYVMVEPDEDCAVLEQGESVLLVRRVGDRFKAIPNPSEALSDEPDR